MAKVKNFNGYHSFNKIKESNNRYENVLESKDKINSTYSDNSLIKKESTLPSLKENNENYEKKKKTRKPFKSPKTKVINFISNNFPLIITSIIGIIAFFLCWSWNTLVDIKVENASLKEKIEFANENISDLKIKYEKVENDDIQNIISKLNFIEGKLSK